MKKFKNNLAIGLLIGFVPFSIFRNNDDPVLAYVGIAILLFCSIVFLISKNREKSEPKD